MAEANGSAASGATAEDIAAAREILDVLRGELETLTAHVIDLRNALNGGNAGAAASLAGELRERYR